MTVGEKIALERKHRKWSQEELAQKAGITQGGLVTVERKGSNPTLNTLTKIAKAFNMSVNDLLDAPKQPHNTA